MLILVVSTGSVIKTPHEVDFGQGKSAMVVNAGTKHTCAILNDDSLVCWGSNLDGLLGNGSSIPSVSENPLRLELGRGRTARALDIDEQHSCAILDDGSLVCWGFNAFGQLGDGSIATRRIPTGVDLEDGKTAVSVSTGEYSTCAILNDNSLVCWGANGFGQLGINNTANQSAPMGVAFAEQETSMDVGVGSNHACAILSDNSVACWGRNEEGQLGVGTSSNEVCSVGGTDYDCIKTPQAVNLGTNRTASGVALGQYHTCALLDNGSVKCWGENGRGQLGDGTSTDRNTPVAVSLPARRSAKRIHAKGNNSCAILDDNSIVCWGGNDFGQLLDGTTIDRHKPVRLK